MNNMKRKELLCKIGEISFSIDELRLFLDTHPNCSEALQYMDSLLKERFDFVACYESKYGPLCSYGINPSTEHWYWVDDAWPWEGEC